jgi:hypothetical protein
MKLAAMSATDLGKMKFIWKNCRKMTDRTQERHYNLEKVLDYYGLEKPKPRIKIETEVLE